MSNSHPTQRRTLRVPPLLWAAGLVLASALLLSIRAGYASEDPSDAGSKAPKDLSRSSGGQEMDAQVGDLEISPEQAEELAWAIRGRHSDRGCCPRPAIGPRAPRLIGGPRGFEPPDHRGAPRGLGGEMGRMAARHLDLSEEQLESLRPIRQEFAEKMRDLHEAFEAGTVSATEAGDRAVQLRVDLEAKSKAILTPEQWSKVDGVRDGHRDRMIERRAGELGRRTDRQTAFYIDCLDLDCTQVSAVRKIMENTIPERRGVADRVKSGSIEPERAFFLMRQIDKDAEREIRALLTPGQAKVLDAIQTLRPFPGRPGMGGPGIGGPGMGGPGMGRPFGPPGMRHPHREGRRGPRL